MRSQGKTRTMTAGVTDQRRRLLAEGAAFSSDGTVVSGNLAARVFIFIFLKCGSDAM